MRIRSRLAIRCGKLAGWMIRKLRRGSGMTFPGYVARLMDPEILSVLSGMVQGGVIAVMGTNGKTTTNHLLCHVLRGEGKRVLMNGTGANMLNGVTAAFVLATDRKGRILADYACVEVDEYASVKILPKLNPSCVLLTNLSRDQLDRFGEVDLTYERIREAVESVPKARLVINGDDPLLVSLLAECANPAVTYGIREQIFPETSRSQALENTFCRFCGTRLEYQFIHYGQLGSYRCPGCGFQRPEPDYAAVNIAFWKDAYIFEIEGFRLQMEACSSYNVYNTLAAYGGLAAMDAPRDHFQEAVSQYDYGNGREGIYRICGARVQLHLAKNPMGFQQKLSLLGQDLSPKDILIEINDEAQDGRDISWLWDVDMEILAKAGAKRIFTAGSRRYDVGLRLKYEGIESSTASDVREAIGRLAETGTKNLYVIVNYSGLYRTSRMLREMEET
ncbi:MAG: DUF1727 domain-containing protein [Lachnospiraceae bacterium]|nr:DUF1727 domain-containing protein [Lachnospiraceae bacterium]